MNFGSVLTFSKLLSPLVYLSCTLQLYVINERKNIYNTQKPFEIVFEQKEIRLLNGALCQIGLVPLPKCGILMIVMCRLFLLILFLN